MGAGFGEGGGVKVEESGLTSSEASKRLVVHGFNEIASAKKQSPFQTALNVVREPMFLLLLTCAIVYIFLGDRAEALMLAGAVVVVIVITFVQERKTERALEALRDLSSPKALVVRDGKQVSVAGRDVVPGDTLVVGEGDRVAADSVLRSSMSLSADESLLSGESVAVRKVPGTEEDMSRPGGEDTPFLFSGTLVVQGSGHATVLATGLQAEIGSIGKSLDSLIQEPTLLEVSTKRLVRSMSITGLSLCVIVIVLFGLFRGSWLDAILAGVTMAISVIPEELPVVLTIFLALGAWRIAQRKVLTRRVPAIETLGAATALCVDKTGTLTENRMSVTKLSVLGLVSEVTTHVVPAGCEELIRYAILASQPQPSDPMEVAICKLRKEPSAGVLERQYPLTADLLAMTHAWKTAAGYSVAAKGAPEAIGLLCRLSAEQTEGVHAEVVALAEQGLRVIAVAKAASTSLPAKQQDFEFSLLGLLGLQDPVRKGVVHAVKECATAGVRVIMITGDYPETARSIARQIGLRSPELVMTGPELEAMSEADLGEKIGAVNVFARVMPEQKLRIVDTLKARGEVVAMTGDGVNDAPALKSADIGIAMGKRGTDVARAAADLVLLNDDFSSIVDAIRLGRRIYANIKDAVSYILAIHVPIAGLSLVPVLLGWPLILLPVHIVFLELIIDPACSIVFEAEPEDEDTMRRPPRKRTDSLFTGRSLAMSLVQGAAVLLAVIGVFFFAVHRGHGAAMARALAYSTLVFANLGLILTNLSLTRPIIQIVQRPNRALWVIVSGVLAMLVAVLYVPFLAKLFKFSTPQIGDLAICFGVAAASVLWFEAVKVARARKRVKATV